VSYTPKHQRQFDGSALAGSDCGPTSLSIAIDAATLGAARPTTECIRRLARDAAGGTTPDDWQRACKAMGIKTYRPATPALLGRALGNAAPVVVAVPYGEWREAGLPAHGSFTGWHAMTLLASGPAHYWLYDPLAQTRARVPRSAVLSFFSGPVIAVAVRRGAWLTRRRK